MNEKNEISSKAPEFDQDLNDQPIPISERDKKLVDLLLWDTRIDPSLDESY